MNRGDSATMPLPVVIDTNVWLDLLVFGDPVGRPIETQLSTGQIAALATGPMRDELADVLARPKFKLDDRTVAAALDRYDSLVQPRAIAPDCHLACRDADDRKFLDLAVATAIGHPGAWLISKDRALLAARRPAARRFRLRIGTPAEFNSRVAAPPDASQPDAIPHLLSAPAPDA